MCPEHRPQQHQHRSQAHAAGHWGWCWRDNRAAWSPQFIGGVKRGVLGIHNAAQKQCGFKAMSSEALSTLEIKVLKKTDGFAHKNKLITRNTLQN